MDQTNNLYLQTDIYGDLECNKIKKECSRIYIQSVIRSNYFVVASRWYHVESKKIVSVLCKCQICKG